MANINFCETCTHPLQDDYCGNPACENCPSIILKRQYKLGKYMALLDEIKDFLEKQYTELDDMMRPSK